MDIWRSVPKKYALFVTVIMAILIALAFGIVARSNQAEPGVIKVRDSSFTVEVASTDEQQIKGLSGRDGIASDYVMIFPFAEAGERCFWMKDMRFAIDMVWLDDTGKVIAIEKNVKPESYPDTFCHDNAKYVAEFASNRTTEIGLSVGDKITVDMIH